MIRFIAKQFIYYHCYFSWVCHLLSFNYSHYDIIALIMLSKYWLCYDIIALILFSSYANLEHDRPTTWFSLSIVLWLLYSAMIFFIYFTLIAIIVKLQWLPHLFFSFHALINHEPSYLFELIETYIIFVTSWSMVHSISIVNWFISLHPRDILN